MPHLQHWLIAVPKPFTFPPTPAPSASDLSDSWELTTEHRHLQDDSGQGAASNFTNCSSPSPLLQGTQLPLWSQEGSGVQRASQLNVTLPKPNMCSLAPNARVFCILMKVKNDSISFCYKPPKKRPNSPSPQRHSDESLQKRR